MNKQALLEETYNSAFNNELEKLSDMTIGPKDGSGKAVAGGIFISGKTEAESKERSEAATKALKEHKSLQKAKAALQKKYKNAFITVAVKKEKAPDYGFLKKLFQKKKYKSATKSYKERSTKPRVFVRSGPQAGYHQKAFYNEVSRGYYDRELNQPHISKKSRVVYA